MSAPREPHLPLAQAPWVEERGDKLRITAVRTFLTAPQGCPYPIVRVETNDPGLYGLGVDFDEFAARGYPAPEPLAHDRWALLRTTDGSVQRP
ncbi:hypothetical protein [Streptomyces sp. NPDC059455]|uniref:hypothetical protein n=1 Tax=Streptomyces sp. NPDC059455 TaxID=3346837 RepID=UPI0036959C58